MSLEPDFKFLEVAYPYVAKRLLTDDDPALRERLLQMLFRDGKFQWKRCENLLALAKDAGGQKLDMSDTLLDGTRFLLSSQADAGKMLQPWTLMRTKLVFDSLQIMMSESNSHL